MPTSEHPGSAARTAVVWEALRPVLERGPCDVLDLGGGTGGSAVRVAERGHRVTVVDPSPDALASLGRRARDAGVEVTATQGDVSTLRTVPGPDGADVVLCHGVLEVVEDPAEALATIREVLRPGGQLSLLVGQRLGAVVARALAGHFQQARDLLAGDTPVGSGRSGRRFTLPELELLLTTAGFEVASVRGVRVFADLVPGALHDVEPGGSAALVELEHAVADRPEFWPLATQLHLLAR